jgi:hypothetical protein
VSRSCAWLEIFLRRVLDGTTPSYQGLRWVQNFWGKDSSELRVCGNASHIYGLRPLKLLSSTYITTVVVVSYLLLSTLLF